MVTGDLRIADIGLFWMRAEINHNFCGLRILAAFYGMQIVLKN